MKILSKVAFNEKEFAVILENGIYGIVHESLIKVDKKGRETVRTFFVRNAFRPEKVPMCELEKMSKIEAISKHGKHIINENGQIINLAKHYEGK